MKSTLKLMATLMLSGGMASAASITVSNLVDTNFIDSDGAALGATFTAKIGFLTNGTVLTTLDDFSSIAANWTNAGNITFASGDADGYVGYFSAQLNFTDALGLAGKNVFVWVTDGAYQNAVLKSNTVQYLSDSAIPNSNGLTIESTELSNLSILLGSFNATSGNDGGSLVLNDSAPTPPPPVPEPSAALLGVVGALGLLRRRRN
jgi:MYXO-CTERM domain-containing protein